MGVEKERRQSGNGKIVYLILTAVILTLFLRFGLFGLLTAYHFPYISLISIAIVLITFVIRIFISLLFKNSAVAKKVARPITAVEWTCWAFFITHPLLLPFTYLRISAKLPLALKLQLVDHLFILAIALIIGALAILSIRKNKIFLYVLLFYASAILTLVSILDAITPDLLTVKDPHEKDAICQVQDVEPIISYKCLDSQKPWCDFLFEHSSPYKIIYHSPTRQFIISGGNSELLVFLDADNKRVNKFLKFNDDVKYLTYDKFRDKILVDVRQKKCVIEVDPYTYQQTGCYFINPSVMEEFQVGCFSADGNILTYNMDTKSHMFTKNYQTGEEQAYNILPFTCAYGMVCYKDSVVISSGCPSPFFKSGFITVTVGPEFKIVQKRWLFLPAMEMEYDARADLLYVARPTQGRVDIYRRDGLKKLSSIKAVSGARELALDEKRGYLYAGSFGSGEIVKINLKSKQIIKSYSAGPLLRDLVFIDELDSAFAVSACGVYKLKD